MTLQTFSGNKGLEANEPLIFEYKRNDGDSGVDLEDFPEFEMLVPSGLLREEIGLPNLSEVDTIRHYTRLSTKNYSIDHGFYPLGSCTMKHNPRLNEKMARLEGIGNLHPFQPVSTVQGALEIMDSIAHWLKNLTKMSAVAISPAAGAHGELAGVMAIRAAHEATGNPRKYILVTESAHGTNPATATACGYEVIKVIANDKGHVDLADLKSKLNKDVAALMLTNPNTCGLFEPDIKKIANLLHEVGAYFYCDGANFNAIMGVVAPGDLGIDCMHINLHKTFSTPHGGGGPGGGPVVFSDKLKDFVPHPLVVLSGSGYEIVENPTNKYGVARIKAFYGQFGVMVRALSYMMSMGIDGIKQAANDAVLSANYVRAELKNAGFSEPFNSYCMHECLFDDTFLEGTGVSTLDIAKALLDEGFHPMTMYFPLVVHGAILIEPTETENKETLDIFINSMIKLFEKAKKGDLAYFQNAPTLTPLRRLDETLAAREPILRFKHVSKNG